MSMTKGLLLVGVIGATVLGGWAGCGSSSRRPPEILAPTEADLRKAMELASEGQAAMERADYERAVTRFEEALSLRPDMGAVWNNYGLALQRRGRELDFMRAVEAFKRAAEQMPTDHRPYQNLGVLYHERGFSEDALSYFVKALERNENALESLRGAVGSAKLLLRSDEAGLARVRRALMLETDPAWRKIHEFERLRIEHDLSERYASPTR
jgi:tetratricopeptide (TPR) repeat protein